MDNFIYGLVTPQQYEDSHAYYHTNFPIEVNKIYQNYVPQRLVSYRALPKELSSEGRIYKNFTVALKMQEQSESHF